MKTYQGLYGIIWLMLLDMLIESKGINFPYVAYVHMLLGAATLAMAFYNYSNVVKTAVPDRTKRITKTYASFAVVQGVLGVIIYIVDTASLDDTLGICQLGIARSLHFVVALAMITQAAAAAISFDMWEDKEFLKESTPGAPPAPLPKPSQSHDK